MASVEGNIGEIESYRYMFDPQSHLDSDEESARHQNQNATC